MVLGLGCGWCPKECNAHARRLRQKSNWWLREWDFLNLALGVRCTEHAFGWWPKDLSAHARKFRVFFELGGSISYETGYFEIGASI